MTSLAWVPGLMWSYAVCHKGVPADPVPSNQTRVCCLCVKTEVLKQHPDVPRLRFPAVRQGVASKTIGSKVTPREKYPRDQKNQGTLPEPSSDSDSGSGGGSDSDSDGDSEGSRGSRLARGWLELSLRLRATACDRANGMQMRWNV